MKYFEHDPKIDSKHRMHGTDPLIPGQFAVTYYCDRPIVGMLIDTNSRKDIYLRADVGTSQGQQIRHYIIDRLLILPLYRMN